MRVFIVDVPAHRHLSHVVNASLGRALSAAERPAKVGPVAVRVGGQWIPVEVTLAEWIPLTEDKRGDVAVLEMTAGRPAGARAVPLRQPHPSMDRRFAVQGFPDSTLIGATGVIRARLTIGQEWAQLEDDKQAGRAVTEGFSGAPVWDTAMKAVVGMATRKMPGHRRPRSPRCCRCRCSPATGRRWRIWCPPAWPWTRCSIRTGIPARAAWRPPTCLAPISGRRRALTELAGWLTADPHPADNLRVVCGGPGSAKIRVLARLVTRSDPSFRQRHPHPSDEPLQVLPEGAIDAAVVARDLDPTQILQVLAERLDFDAADVDELVAALAAYGRPVTVVVDGLDESAAPRQAAALLRRAAGDTADLGVRLLVGTRPGPQNKLPQALGAGAARNAINLDDPGYLEKADLAEYVRRRLLMEGVPPDRLPARGTPYRGHHRLAERVAAAVADRPTRHF